MRIKLLLPLCALFLVSKVAPQDLPTQLTPDYVNKIKAASSANLPQKPRVNRETTDLQDNRLKGKVRSVVEEIEALAADGSAKSRYIGSVRDYDNGGNLLRRISLDSAGPFDLTVYGYIDGRRVSKTSSIPNPNVFRGGIPAGEKDAFKPTRKSDPRFSSEYRYKYEKGQLVEMHIFHSDGSNGMRYTYRRTANEFEELAYGYDQKLNQKYVSKLDERGNEIELLDVAVINQWRGDRRYRFTYESFDKNGNWTKRVKSEVLTENGKEILKPWYATYRTIIYHS